MAPDVLPYGSWPTPITAARVVEAAVRLGGLRADGGDLWWLELRPQEGGRTGLVRRRADGTIEDLLPAPWNVRTAVHEYGGGAAWFRDGVAWFTNWADQRLYRLEPGRGAGGRSPPSRPVPRGLRYADGDVSPDGPLSPASASATRPTATVVERDRAAAGRRGGDAEVIVTGPDFVSQPPLAARRRGAGWIEWDHPNMPWDGTRLSPASSGEDVPRGRRRREESVLQPVLGAGRHAAVPLRPQRLVEPLPLVAVRRVEPRSSASTAEIGEPQWVFGRPRYALARRRLDRLRLLARRLRPPRPPSTRRPSCGRARPAVLASRPTSRVTGTTVHAIAASPAAGGAPSSPSTCAAGAGHGAAPAAGLGLDPGFLPPPEADRLPDHRRAHRPRASSTRPANPDFAGPPRRAAAAHRRSSTAARRRRPGRRCSSTSGSGPAGASPSST